MIEEELKEPELNLNRVNSGADNDIEVNKIMGEQSQIQNNH